NDRNSTWIYSAKQQLLFMSNFANNNTRKQNLRGLSRKLFNLAERNQNFFLTMGREWPENKLGMVTVSVGKSRAQPIRLKLSTETLILQREELVYVQSEITQKDPAILSRIRVVMIPREKNGGLGVSVKGGAEHNLPILISRIFKDQAADKTGKLYVGDAILKVNGVDMDGCTHDDAVAALKKAGDEVTLSVRYFRPASLFLSRNRRNTRTGSVTSPTSASGDESDTGTLTKPKLEKQWSDILCVPLLFAYITRYHPGTDKIRHNAFEVVGMDGGSSGTIHCDNTITYLEWMRCITHNINMLNNHSITMSNKLLLPAEQISHMCWTCERLMATHHWHNWKPQFLALKGSDIYLFDSPPSSTRDWTRCERIYKIYDCMFRILKDSELQDERQHCFSIQHGSGETHYLCSESRQELLKLEKEWFRTNYMAVLHQRSKTFGCSWRGRISGLTLDMNMGFSLYDSETKSYMWNYKFSQLKGSSDDDKTKLKLHFLNEHTKQIDSREVECSNLKTLLYSMHSFLSAKLASVDPCFLQDT
ncbi:unnamed protein product, partial [Owenia fusiformis]